MNLLSYNIQKPSVIQTTVSGSFTAKRAQEFVAARGNRLELLRIDDATEKIVVVCSSPSFCVIRSLYSFRTEGAERDVLVVGSDSGKITILEYDNAISDWKTLHNESFGKSGCRRIVPGQYIAADPRGRAIMIAAIEKQRFVYEMNRDSKDKLTISSPLEAHEKETVTYSAVGVDVAWDNPVFALLEMSYTDSDADSSGQAFEEAEKKITYYTLDLGLHHMIKSWTQVVSRGANFLLSVPGGDEGPSGVLVCGENWISYINQGHGEIIAPIPRRADLPPNQSTLLTVGSLHKNKQGFFYFIQSEFGDLYKVNLTLSPDKKSVLDIVVIVFDTLPSASSLCITKTGYLFAPSEFSNHYLFQICSIDDADAVKSNRLSDEVRDNEFAENNETAARLSPTFVPSGKLKHLVISDDINSMAPITDMLVDQSANQDSRQINLLCGTRNRSSFRILKHGVSVSEIAVSELPGTPTGVWTVKSSAVSTEGSPNFDRYIIISYMNATLVLGAEGGSIEEVNTSGFLLNVQTLHVSLLADNTIVQVHKHGIRIIKATSNKTRQFDPVKEGHIECATANSRQVIVSLSGGEKDGCLVYFEQDPATGTLNEHEFKFKEKFGKSICSLDLGVVPAGRVRSSFLAVGSWDNTVHLLSLDPSDVFGQRSFLDVGSRPVSLALIEMMTDRGYGAGSTQTTGADLSSLYLNIGLENGIIRRVSVDSVTGSLTDSRPRFLGYRAVSISRVSVNNSQALIALSLRPWLLYNFQGKYVQAPLSYDSLEFAASFSSEACPEGMVVTTGNTFRIITVENLGELFNQTVFPLRYTPRRMARVPGTQDIVIIESDHNEFTDEEKAARDSSSSSAAAGGGAVDMEGDGEEEAGTRVIIRGPMPENPGKWASCIRILDSLTGNSKDLGYLQDNFSAVSMCICDLKLAETMEERYVVIGISKDIQLSPRSSSSNFIYVYKIVQDRLSLVHKTEVEDIPTVVVGFQGKLLVGLGRCLRLYSLGRKKMLKSCENKQFPVLICKIQTYGDRIFVGDVVESLHFVKYKRVDTDNSLVIFADDVCPRYVTSFCVLDYHTVCVGDKFGNVLVLRLPENAIDDIDNPTGSKIMWDQGLLNGAPTKLNNLTHYYVGEAITSVVKSSFVEGGSEVIVVSTIYGSIYVFTPFKSKEDYGFFQHLEMFMRQEQQTLCQRDHMSYRSYYQPVKSTIDGDLCERYSSLLYIKQKEFADDTGRTPAEVFKRLEEMRNIL